jgi:hypothetical protein
LGKWTNDRRNLASWKWIWWHTILIDIVSTTKAITDNKSDEWEKKDKVALDFLPSSSFCMSLYCEWIDLFDTNNKQPESPEVK